METRRLSKGYDIDSTQDLSRWRLGLDRSIDYAELNFAGTVRDYPGVSTGSYVLY